MASTGASGLAPSWWRCAVGRRHLLSVAVLLCSSRSCFCVAALSLVSHAWFVARPADHHLRSVERLIGQNYSSISLRSCCQMLGLGPDQAAARTRPRGHPVVVGVALCLVAAAVVCAFGCSRPCARRRRCARLARGQRHALCLSGARRRAQDAERGHAADGPAYRLCGGARELTRRAAPPPPPPPADRYVIEHSPFPPVCVPAS